MRKNGFCIFGIRRAPRATRRDNHGESGENGELKSEIRIGSRSEREGTSGVNFLPTIQRNSVYSSRLLEIYDGDTGILEFLLRMTSMTFKAMEGLL